MLTDKLTQESPTAWSLRQANGRGCKAVARLAGLALLLSLVALAARESSSPAAPDASAQPPTAQTDQTRHQQWRALSVPPQVSRRQPLPEPQRATTLAANQLKVYVAPLKPALNTDLLTDRYDTKRWWHAFGTDAEDMLTEPLGRLIGSYRDMELRSSHIFGGGVYFYTQLLNSPLRVDSAEEADVMFIGFWADLLCRMSQDTKDDAHSAALWADCQKEMAGFWERFDTDFPLAATKPHLMVFGRGEGELMSGCGAGKSALSGFAKRPGVEITKTRKLCSFLCHPKADLLNVMTPELFTGQDNFNGTVTSPQPVRRNSWTSLPFLSHWHVNSSSARQGWPFDPERHEKSKRRLAMESMQVRGPLRVYLHQNCADRPTELCRYLKLKHRPLDYDHAMILDEVRKSWTCLQPAGDGTIPVFFDRHTKDIMPFADILDWDDLSITIDAIGMMARGENAIDLLNARFDLDRALQISQQVHELRHLLLYSQEPDHSLVRFDEMDLLHPGDDAFTAAMKSFMRHACRSGQLPVAKCRSTVAGGTTAVAR